MTQRNKDNDDVTTMEKFDFRKLDFDAIREREQEEARRRLKELEQKRKEAEEKAKIPPPKTYSVEEHEAAKKDAFEKGQEVGFNKATETQNQKIESMLETLLPQLHTLIEEDRLRLLKQEQDMVRIAFSVVKKILPKTLENTRKDEIEHFIQENLPLHEDKTKINIRVHKDLLEDARKKITEIADQKGMTCQFNFVADENIGLDGCRLEWSDGGVERRTDDLMITLEKLFGRFADKVGQEKIKEETHINHNEQTENTIDEETATTTENVSINESAETDTDLEKGPNTEETGTTEATKETPDNEGDVTTELETAENPPDNQTNAPTEEEDPLQNTISDDKQSEQQQGEKE